MSLLLFRKTYCPFHKHENSKVQKPPSQLRFSPPSIIITITSNEPSNTETHKTDRNPPITNHKPYPFEPVKDDWLQRKTRLPQLEIKRTRWQWACASADCVPLSYLFISPTNVGLPQKIKPEHTDRLNYIWDSLQKEN